MGQEIVAKRFVPDDFAAFRQRLEEETACLAQKLAGGAFSPSGYTAGFEVEGWLIDRDGFPAPDNQAFLARLDSPLVVPELSRFNFELNCEPQPLAGHALSRLEATLAGLLRRCQDCAEALDHDVALIGILPTVSERHLCLANMSPLNRYYALNEQVLAARGGQPLHLCIDGRETLALTHSDVMLEAATTSFQAHLQVPAAQAARFYNASAMLAAPMVAVSANSPFLFGHSLWEETRVPLFEQGVDTGDDAHPERRRVTFGSGYLGESCVEHFLENLERYCVLLPILFDTPAEEMAHLRLHNGTIWRWNRLLVGLPPHDRAHLRIEHRVMAAGPSIVDMMANAALYYGAVRLLALQAAAPEHQLPFVQARENFYAAARHGLDAEIQWPDGHRCQVGALVREVVLPMAREGLAELGIAAEDADRLLAVIAARVRSGQTGARWQRDHAHRHGRDLRRLTADYVRHQRGGSPVHEWSV
ncbi:MAG: glutamate--cysteine ligase [Betaproteobacteria bacterium]|nr:glutamate--cysteine ligase [Betaproteobacteria bacterium]